MKGFLQKLYECFFAWSVEAATTSRVRSAQVVLGQSFGAGKKDPGATNQVLARVAWKLHTDHSIPLILQWEIAGWLKGVEFAVVVRDHRRRGQYLDTREVLQQAWLTCREKGWTKAVIVAHPDHGWRVAKMAEKIGFTVVVVNTKAPYDPLSTQWWTRSAWHFIPREILARLTCLVRGWI